MFHAKKILPSKLNKTKEVKTICPEPQASLSKLENELAWLTSSSERTMILEAASGPLSLHTDFRHVYLLAWTNKPGRQVARGNIRLKVSA